MKKQNNKGFISQILLGAIAIGSLVAGYFAAPEVKNYLNEVKETPQEVVQEQNLGATNQIPTPIALFETTLASSITSSATSFTLTSAVDKDGTTFATSTYAFIIDEGTASEEFVIADCTGTACTNAERGISVRTGETEVTALKKAHRRGASIKITDAPSLLILSRLSQGVTDYENVLRYDSGLSTTTIASDPRNIVNVELLNEVAFNGANIISSTETSRGLVELATQSEMASSTQTGSSGPLALQSRYATSTAPASGHYIPVTGADGNLDTGFFPSSLSNVTFTGTTTFNGPIVNASSTVQLTYNSSGTYTKPSNLSYVRVQAWGGGGGGNNSPDINGSGGGGGGGAYNEAYIWASSLSSSETITIGAGGNVAQAGGNTTFGSHITAYGGGTGGSDVDSAQGGGGGGGGLWGAGANGAGNAANGAAGSGPTGFSGGAGGGNSAYWGGGGGNLVDSGGRSEWGGGGGAGYNSGSGGASKYGGTGGAWRSNGTAPGGGGGGSDNSSFSAGQGAAGRIIVTEFY